MISPAKDDVLSLLSEKRIQRRLKGIDILFVKNNLTLIEASKKLDLENVSGDFLPAPAAAASDSRKPIAIAAAAVIPVEVE